MGDKIDHEQSLSNLFTDEGDNDTVFAEQSMASSLSCIAVDKEHKQQSSSSTNSSMQASKSISTLFGKMTWNGSTTSFMGTGDELLNFSSSTDDLEGSSDALALCKKPRASKRFVPKYKYKPTTLQTKLSPIKDKRVIKAVLKTRKKSAPKLQEIANDTNDNDFDASISVADVLAINWQRSKDVQTPKFDEVAGQDSILSETKRKPKRGLSRKESCLFESGRNKLRKATTSSRNMDDIAPKCPRRCESPAEEERTLRLRVNDDI